MKIFLDILGAGACPAFVVLEQLDVVVGMRETEVNRAGEGLPHFAAEAVWEAHLDETRALGISKESEVAAMR